MRKTGIAVLLVAAAVQPARADHARLAYAGDACARADLERRIAELDAHDTFAADGTLRIDILVDGAPGALRASIVANGAGGNERGRRELSAPRCDDLFDAVALVAILVANEVLQARAEPAPAPQPSPEPAIEIEVAPLRPESAVMVLAGAASGTGGTDAIAGVRLRGAEHSLGVYAGVGLPERLPMATITRYQLSLVPCEQLGRLALCLDVSGGVVSGRSAQTVYDPLLAAGVRVGWEQPLTRRIGLGAEVGVEAAVTHEQFRVDDVIVWSSHRVEMWGGLEVLVSIP